MDGVVEPTGPGAEAPPALSSRIAQSRLIVTGTVSHVDGPNLEIVVDEVLKGMASPGETVEVSSVTPRPWAKSTRVMPVCGSSRAKVIRPDSWPGDPWE